VRQGSVQDLAKKLLLVSGGALPIRFAAAANLEGPREPEEAEEPEDAESEGAEEPEAGGGPELAHGEAIVNTANLSRPTIGAGRRRRPTRVERQLPDA
jgi:hypothetical protein